MLLFAPLVTFRPPSGDTALVVSLSPLGDASSLADSAETLQSLRETESPTFLPSLSAKNKNPSFLVKIKKHVLTSIFAKEQKRNSIFCEK